VRFLGLRKRQSSRRRNASSNQLFL